MKSTRALAFTFTFVLCSVAHAQTSGFALDRYDPAEHGGDWFAGDTLDLRGQLRPALGLTLDWAHDPLVVYDGNGDQQAAIVENQLYAHLGGGLRMWDRVRFAVNLPIALWQSGDEGTLDGMTLSSSNDTALGDLRLGVDVRLFGAYREVVTLALGVQAHLPTGDREAFTGDGKLRLVPHALLAGEIASFMYSARLGFVYRAQDDELGRVPTGSELQFVVSAGLRLVQGALVIGPELWGTTVVAHGAAFERGTTPFELLFGAHYRAGDYRFGLGIGPGLTRGLGAPASRVLLSFAWSPEPQEAEPEAAVPAPSDRDRDGIADQSDACPDVAGVASSDASKNGCPSDRDGDGIVDAQDACPDVPGVRSEDPAKNGCPGDRDGDQIIDPQDACPNDPGAADPDPGKNGCPKARVEQGQIKIIERIEFKTNSAVILPESAPTLEAVRAILADHPEIAHLAVEGHTDNVGKEAYNQKLSERRAAAVVSWLTQHGIAHKRLSSQGFGMARPLDSNDNEQGRERNRRVEFHIGGAADAAGAGSTDSAIEEK